MSSACKIHLKQKSTSLHCLHLCLVPITACTWHNCQQCLLIKNSPVVIGAGQLYATSSEGDRHNIPEADREISGTHTDWQQSQNTEPCWYPPFCKISVRRRNEGFFFCRPEDSPSRLDVSTSSVNSSNSMFLVWPWNRATCSGAHT